MTSRKDHADYCTLHAALGLNATMLKKYLGFIANRRCQQIRVDPLIDKADNQFPWMAEMIDLKSETDFFEPWTVDALS